MIVANPVARKQNACCQDKWHHVCSLTDSWCLRVTFQMGDPGQPRNQAWKQTLLSCGALCCELKTLHAFGKLLLFRWLFYSQQLVSYPHILHLGYSPTWSNHLKLSLLKDVMSSSWDCECLLNAKHWIVIAILNKLVILLCFCITVHASEWNKILCMKKSWVHTIKSRPLIELLEVEFASS